MLAAEKKKEGKKRQFQNVKILSFTPLQYCCIANLNVNCELNARIQRRREKKNARRCYNMYGSGVMVGVHFKCGSRVRVDEKRIND